jgi:hypothetical protein
MPTSVSSRRARAVVSVAVFALLTACGDDTGTSGSSAPNVGLMRLIIDNQVLSIDRNGKETGTVVIRSGAPASVTAIFLKENGDVDPAVTPGKYQLNLTVISTVANWNFQRSNTNPFAGTLTVNSGIQSLTLRVSLREVEGNRDHFGPWEAHLTVQPQ